MTVSRGLCVVMLLANPDGRGGTQRQAYLLARELGTRGISVAHVRRDYQRTTAPVGQVDGPSASTVRLRALRWLPGWSFLVSFLCWAALNRRRFGLIHAHNTSLGVVAACAGWLLNKPVVTKVTSMQVVAALAHRSPDRRLRRWILSHGTHLIAVSTEMYSALVHAGIPHTAMQLIPNGVALAPCGADEPDAECRAPVVLFVGRLTERKRVDLLLEVWAAMRRPGHAALVIVGDGPLRRRLEGAAVRLGISSSVRFVGVQADVTRFYRTADVFALPSATEGMSNALLEAMAAGVTVVASDVGGNREVVEHGRSGFLVDWSDAAACARLLSDLLDDAACRARVGQAARERAACFSIDTVAERYCQLYRELLAGDGRRPS
jgi:glycosyltransferase involved in cell wall biosynthesis